MSRDLKIGFVAAVLFVASVGGVAMYKKKTDADWQLADLSALVGDPPKLPEPSEKSPQAAVAAAVASKTDDAPPPPPNLPSAPVVKSANKENPPSAVPPAVKTAAASAATTATTPPTAPKVDKQVRPASAKDEKSDKFDMPLPPPVLPLVDEPKEGAKAPAVPLAKEKSASPPATSADAAMPPPPSFDSPKPPAAKKVDSADATSKPKAVADEDAPKTPSKLEMPPPPPVVAGDPSAAAEPAPQRAPSRVGLGRGGDESAADAPPTAIRSEPPMERSPESTPPKAPRKVIPSPRTYTSTPVVEKPAATSDLNRTLEDDYRDAAARNRRVADSAADDVRPTMRARESVRPTVKSSLSRGDDAAQLGMAVANAGVIARGVAVQPGEETNKPVGVGSVKASPVDNGLKPIAVSRPLTPPSASSINAASPAEGEGFRSVPPGTSVDSYIRVPDSAARPGGKNEFMNVTPAPGIIPAASARTQAPSASAPSVRSYDVESYLILDGDSYDSIAASVYKNRELGPALARYNRWMGSSTEKLTSGRRVLLPPETVLSNPERTAAPKLLPTPSRAASSPPAGAGPTYTVEREETLYSIAKRTLGDGKRWREIYKLNTDRLGSEFDVPVGVTLRLPTEGGRR